MKTTIAVLGQLILFTFFVAVFIGFSLFDPFHLKWFVTHPTLTSTRWFVPDGLLVMTAIYLFVLGIEAAAKKLRTAGLWTSITYIAALVIGLIFKFGFITRDMY